MNPADQLLTVCDAYCAVCAISRTRLSTLLFSRGTRLEEIAGGGDIGSRLLERKLRWLSDHWPDRADWPDGVERPAPTAQEAAE